MIRTRAVACSMACALALLLAACGGGGGPPDQTPAVREEMVGTVTGGETTGAAEAAGEFAAKGTAGILRVANVQADSLDYRVSLVQLTGPYALRAILGNDQTQVNVYSVALAQGVANITPLTTLVIAQLYGQDPAAIYNAFGTGGSVDASRITAPNLQAAQAKVVAYLREDLGVPVADGLGDFVTTPFKAKAGDPMYDAVAAIAAKLRADGSSFQALNEAVALASRQCQTESVAIAIGGRTFDFCPASKSATPRDGDPTLLDYLFVDRRNNRLTAEVRGDTVLAARYETAAGAAYTCADTACAALTLGTPAADLTRNVVFANLALAGAGGTATVAGTLAGAIPGVALPVLPCDTNRFIAVMSDRSVIGACADPDPYGYGVGGVPGSLIGVDVSRGLYEFMAPFGEDATQAKVSVITDGYDTVLAVQLTDNEPDTYVPRRRFACVLEACNGITLGPVTLNTDFGGPDFPFYIRTLNFADTSLAGVDDNGAPTGLTAKLRASLTAAYLLPVPPLTYPALADCMPDLTPLPVTAAGHAFNACLPAGQTNVQPNGDVELSASSVFESDDKLSVVLRNGAVVSATLKLSVVPGDFVCKGNCAGITVSAPDGTGARTVTLGGGTSLNEQFFGVAGPRAVRLGSGTLAFAPPLQ